VKGKQMQENYWVILAIFFSLLDVHDISDIYREIQQNLQGVPETPWVSDPLT
jgi:hypothetical protein